MLYKYLSRARVDVLASLKVRLSPRLALNDPFEFCATPDREAIRNQLVVANKTIFKTEARKARSSFSDLNRAQYRKGIAGARRQAKRDLRTAPDDFTRDLLAQADERLVVFSCSELPECVPMWAHYTENHRGFQIGFDQATIFGGSTASARDKIILRRITYTDETPRLIPGETEIFEFASKKMSDWAYEREWRYLSTIEFADLSVDDLALFHINHQAIKEITFGVHADAELVRMVMSNTKISGIDCAFFRMTAGRDEFGLLRSPL